MCISKHFTIAFLPVFKQYLQAEVHVRLSSNHSLSYNLFLVKEENVAVSASVKNILIGSTLTPFAVIVIDWVENDGVRCEEAVRTPVSFLIRILPKRDDAELFSIASNSWFLLLQLSVFVLDKAEMLAIHNFFVEVLYMALLINLILSHTRVCRIIRLLRLNTVHKGRRLLWPTNGCII